MITIVAMTLALILPFVDRPACRRRLQAFARALTDRTATAAADAGRGAQAGRLPEPLRPEFHDALSRLLLVSDSDTIIAELLRTSIEVAGATQGAVFLYSPTDPFLRYHISHGVRPELDLRLRNRPGYRLGAARGITGLVATGAEPLYIPDVLRDPRWTGTSPTRRSALWVPLRVGEELFGVFNVLSDRVDGISPIDRNFIGTMARYVAVVLERQRRHREMAQAQERDHLLANLSLEIDELSDLDSVLSLGLAHALAASATDAALYLSTDLYGVSRLNRLVGQVPPGLKRWLERTAFAPGKGAVGRAVYARDLQMLTPADAGEGLDPELSSAGVQFMALIPVSHHNEVIGVLGLISFRPYGELAGPTLQWLQGLAGRISVAHQQIEQEKVVEQITLGREAALQVIGRALELRDFETSGHTARVTDLALRLASRVSEDEEFLRAIRWGALLHDIGKLAVPDAILLKPGPLDGAERSWIERHTVLGAEMLAHMAYLPRVTLDVVRHHHERWDGTGYPDRLQGEEISLGARLFAIVDVYDALISSRPYKRAWSREDARRFLWEQAGRQFDPELVEHFLAVLAEEAEGEHSIAAGMD